MVGSWLDLSGSRCGQIGCCEHGNEPLIFWSTSSSRTLLGRMSYSEALYKIQKHLLRHSSDDIICFKHKKATDFGHEVYLFVSHYFCNRDHLPTGLSNRDCRCLPADRNRIPIIEADFPFTVLRVYAYWNSVSVMVQIVRTHPKSSHFLNK